MIKITQNQELINHNLIELLTICADAKFNSAIVIEGLQSCKFERDGVKCENCACLRWCIGIKHVLLNEDYILDDDCYKCKDVVKCMKSKVYPPYFKNLNTLTFNCSRRHYERDVY